MNLEDIALDVKAYDEIERYKPLLDIQLRLNKPFDYLSLIAEKYGVDKAVVIEKNFDLFSFYKNTLKMSSDKAMYESILKTHYLVATDGFF